MGDFVTEFALAFGPLLRQLVAEEVAKAVKVAGADDLVPHHKVALPARVACAACAAGEVAGARKLGRRWLAPRSAWLAYIDAHATRRGDAPANDTADNEAELLAFVRGAGSKL